MVKRTAKRQSEAREQIGQRLAQELKTMKAKYAMEQSMRALMGHLNQQFGFTAQDQQELVSGVRAQIAAGTLHPLVAEEQVAFLRSLPTTA
jgi:hypothetical protein